MHPWLFKNSDTCFSLLEVDFNLAFNDASTEVVSVV